MAGPHDLSLTDAILGGEAPAALLDHALRFVRVNEGWERSAEDGGLGRGHPSWAAGASYLDAIGPALRPWFARALADALGSSEPWHHDYDCSTAELERRFRLTAYPHRGEGLVLVHTCRVERPHPRAAEPIETYRDEHGIVHVCMQCRRTRRLDLRGWDWVPAAQRTDVASHGICEPCAAYYFGALPDR